MFFIKERIMVLGIDQNQDGVFLVVQSLVEILEMQSQILTIFIVQKDAIKIGERNEI